VIASEPAPGPAAVGTARASRDDAEGRPERADLYSMRRWRPSAERRKYSAFGAINERRSSAMRSLSAISKGGPRSRPELVAVVGDGPAGARFSVMGSPRQSLALSASGQAARRRPCGSGSGLSFGLIHSRSRRFTGDCGAPVRAGQGRWRPVVDAGAQSSKACEGATPPWVQIPPPPPLTRHDAERCPAGFWLPGGCCLSLWPRNGCWARPGHVCGSAVRTPPPALRRPRPQQRPDWSWDRISRRARLPLPVAGWRRRGRGWHRGRRRYLVPRAAASGLRPAGRG
jgi:hypothetical protein